MPPQPSGKTYFFLHIPKTAGTSLTVLLDALFPADRVCPGYIWSYLTEAPREDLDRFRFFRGHLPGDMAGFLNRNVEEFTFVREPVARTISHYRHVLRDAESPLHTSAIKLGSLKACLANDAFRELFSNYQTKYLADYGIPGANEQQATPEVPPAALLERAKRRLDAMRSVGTAERFEASVDVLCHVMEWNLPIRAVHENVNPGWTDKRTYAAEDVEVIRSANLLDVEIYQYANSLLDRQIAGMARHRAQHPDIWMERYEQRIALLTENAMSQANRLSQYEAHRATYGGRLGIWVQARLNAIAPPGSTVRKRLQGLERLMRRQHHPEGLNPPRPRPGQPA